MAESLPALGVGSLNVRGLNSPTKRSLVSREFRRAKLDILFLQETHWPLGKEPKLRGGGIGEVFSASHKGKKRGVAILLARGVNFEKETILKDPGGRYLLVRGTLQGAPLTLAVIYGPNEGQAQFWEEMRDKLKLFVHGTVVVGGDFNMVLDPIRDRKRTGPQIPRAADEIMARTFQRVNSELGLVDTVPTPRSETPSFTYYSAIHTSFSRIDYILVDESLFPFISGYRVEPVPWSDHDLVRVTIAREGLSDRGGRWKCNDFLLKDEVRAQEVLEAITEFFEFNDNGEVGLHTLWDAFKATLRGVLIKIGAREKRVRAVKERCLREKIAQFQPGGSPAEPLDRDRIAALDDYRLQLKELLLQKTERSLQLVRQRYYRRGTGRT